MRFCTSELKTAVIYSKLKQMFPGMVIISVAGIRADESPNRAKSPISAPVNKLARKSDQTSGITWHPILHWTEEMVYAYLRHRQFELHEAYTKYGSSRVSCSFCIMGSESDLLAAMKCEANHEALIRIIELELKSAFCFQAGRWLGDLIQKADVEVRRKIQAKFEGAIDWPRRVHSAGQICKRRMELEERIPKHLHYEKGWPNTLPTKQEAAVLAEVRSHVGLLQGLKPLYTTADDVLGRYQQLTQEKQDEG